MFRMALLSLLVVFFGISGIRAQNAPRDITFFLTFIPNIQFAPVYVAMEKGYFAEHGLNVSVQHGDEPDGVNLVAANELQFGVFSGEQVIVARAQGRPVTFVYEWFQQFPVGILVTEGSGIHSPADLRGQRIGVPGLFGASYTGVIAFLAANGLTEQDVQLEVIGFNAPQVVCVGGVPASVIYINNEPLQIENRIAAGDCGDLTGISVFPVTEVADMVSNGVVTNEETIANDPDLVANFVAAFDQGLRDTIANPAEAYLLSVAHVDGLPLSDELRTALEAAAADPTVDRDEWLVSLKADISGDSLLQLEVLLSSIAMWNADRLGVTEESSWELTQDTLISMGTLDEPIDLSAAFTNDFLPEVP